MIESRYWRAELRRDLAWLRAHRKFRRRSEKQHVLFERRLMLVAFQIRSLLERPKVNDKARETRMPAQRYKKVRDRPFTLVGPGWPEDRFDLEHPESHSLSALEVCNQLIHYYWMQTLTDGQSFASMLVFSDYKRHAWAYEFQISDLLALFRGFANKSSSIAAAEFVWDEKKQDYVLRKAASPLDVLESGSGAVTTIRGSD